MSKFIAVEFNSDLCEYAALPLDKVLNGNLRALKNNLVGRKVGVLWGRKTFFVKVLGYGTKEAMESDCNKLAEEGATGQNAIGHDASQKNSKSSKSFEDDNSDVLVSDQPTEQDYKNIELAEPEIDNPESEEINQMRRKILKLKESVRKYNVRAKELKRLNLELMEQRDLASLEENIELVIGSGVYLPKSAIAAAKLTSKSPPILARRLFRQVFQHQDMRGRSLFGRKCNANPNKQKSLPVVDGVKRDAVIGFALQAYDLKPSSKSGTVNGICMYSLHKKKIIDSLNKLLREVNR